MKIDDDKFFENMLSASYVLRLVVTHLLSENTPIPLSANEEFKAWLKLGKPRNAQEWEMYPSMVNAYFNPPANEVICFLSTDDADFLRTRIDRFPSRNYASSIL